MTTLYPPNPLSVDGSIVSISSLAEHFYNVRAALTDSPSSSASAYSLGGFHIRIQFGSELLREQISPAIDHLCDERDSETALTVFLHDHFSAPAAGSLVSSRNYSTDETETWLMDDSDVTLILQQQGRLVSLLDWGRNAAHWLISDATSIPYLERAEPLRAILSYWLARRERYLIHGAAVGNSNGGVLIIGQFMLQRIDLTRYQSAESFESRRQHDSIERLRVDSERMAWLQAAYALAQNSAVAFASIVILVVGGLDVAMGRISLGSLLSFYVVTALFSGSLQQLFAAVPHVMEGRQSLCAINSFYSEGVTSPYSGTVRSQFNGSIEFASVCFGYDSRLLLEDASLVLERGSMTAIVGPNGGGKTTLARLILGLYRPRRGRLLADGTPYDQLNIADLRRCIAFAPQDPAIFAGTIWENLTYGLPDSSADKIMKACEFALVHEFVCRLPRGYQTHVDDDGGILSGGQRQKIAIARALACQPRLLILDEPTNHLDEESVQKILHNLRALPRSLTILIITQDRSVAEAIPQKYLLNEGRLTPMWTTSRSNPGTRLHNKPSYTEVTP